MGLLDKVKGILFDEEEVEIPEIKKEVRKEPKKELVVEEENPIKEIKVPKDDFSDREYKSETTFTFPIDFDDDEPVKEETPKVKVEEHSKVQTSRKDDKRDFSEFLNKKNEKKQFKPTPIISPVYGVLDQNYKKDDVIVKKDILRSPKELTLDEVRKRAFGSLEDELERNLTGETKEIKIKEELKIKKESTIEAVPVSGSDDLEPVDKMKTIGELIEEDDSRLDIPEIDGINDDEYEYNNTSQIDIDEPTNSIEDLLSHNDEKQDTAIVKDDISDNDIDDEEADLFSLIDSMYEEKGE